jgi:hypothetical protein
MTLPESQNPARVVTRNRESNINRTLRIVSENPNPRRRWRARPPIRRIKISAELCADLVAMGGAAP